MSVDLETLQSQFSQYVLEGDDEIKTQIVSTKVLKSDLRLAIYANAYVSRMIETLQNDFPILNQLLGEEQFFTLATAYTRKHPSNNASLKWFGQHMVSYLQSLPAYAETGYVAEVAQLEWALANTFSMADADVITEVDAANVPPEKWPELTLQFHPSVNWFSYHWNVIAIWNAIKNEEEFPAAVKLNAPEKCVVWRYELRTLFRTLEPLESDVFHLMMEDVSFGELCELMSENSDTPQDVPMQAAGLLKAWINNGMISGLSF